MIREHLRQKRLCRVYFSITEMVTNTNQFSELWTRWEWWHGSCSIQYHQWVSQSYADTWEMLLAKLRHRRLWPHLDVFLPRARGHLKLPFGSGAGHCVPAQGRRRLHHLPLTASQKGVLAYAEDQNLAILVSLAWLILVCISIAKSKSSA